VNRLPQIPVAVFLTRFEPGGTERQMTELVRRLDPGRFRVHVACFDRRGGWLPRVAERAASIVEFPVQGFARPSTAARLAAFARWCRRERIAVVQTCDLYANIFGLPGAALAGVPVRIGSRRELNPDKTAGQIRLQRQAYRCATKVVANSRAAAEMLRREGLAPASIAVIPNGVDTTGFPDRDVSARRSRPLRSIATVANLRREKSHETLLAAAAILRPEFPDVRYQIVGSGPRRAELEALARAKDLQEQVTFLGHRDDVAALLAAADLFVLPSRSEAFPNSVVEAMAAGLPVVACAVGGLLELIDDGRTGLLVPPDDPVALAGALRRLLADRPAADRIGAAARAEVAERYSFDGMVASFEALYLSALAAHSPSLAPRAQAAGI
jgi:glycosyltransferase involved in cell wall biosynthesis